MKSKRRMPAKVRIAADEDERSNEECLLIQEEIWRVVEEASRSGSALSIKAPANRIRDAFPASGLTAQNIADALVFAAVDAGVMLQKDVPLPRQVVLDRLPRLTLAALRGRAQAAIATPPSALAISAPA